jgi:hypothetical protein
LTIIIKTDIFKIVFRDSKKSKEAHLMSETVVGGISRTRKQGRGEITLTQELLHQIKVTVPQWVELQPKKILDMIDRALPITPSDSHLVSFSLPGGKQKIQIPVSIQTGEAALSLILKPHDTKPVRIKDC